MTVDQTQPLVAERGDRDEQHEARGDRAERRVERRADHSASAPANHSATSASSSALPTAGDRHHRGAQHVRRVAEIVEVLLERLRCREGRAASCRVRRRTRVNTNPAATTSSAASHAGSLRWSVHASSACGAIAASNAAPNHDAPANTVVSPRATATVRPARVMLTGETSAALPSEHGLVPGVGQGVVGAVRHDDRSEAAAAHPDARAFGHRRRRP